MLGCMYNGFLHCSEKCICVLVGYIASLKDKSTKSKLFYIKRIITKWSWNGIFLLIELNFYLHNYWCFEHFSLWMWFRMHTNMFVEISRVYCDFTRTIQTSVYLIQLSEFRSLPTLLEVVCVHSIEYTAAGYILLNIN